MTWPTVFFLLLQATLHTDDDTRDSISTIVSWLLPYRSGSSSGGGGIMRWDEMTLWNSSWVPALLLLLLLLRLQLLLLKERGAMRTDSIHPLNRQGPHLFPHRNTKIHARKGTRTVCTAAHTQAHSQKTPNKPTHLQAYIAHTHTCISLDLAVVYKRIFPCKCGH